MTYNRVRRELHLDLCMAAFFGCNIQPDLGAIHASIHREEYMAKNREEKIFFIPRTRRKKNSTHFIGCQNSE